MVLGFRVDIESLDIKMLIYMLKEEINYLQIQKKHFIIPNNFKKIISGRKFQKLIGKEKAKALLLNGTASRNGGCICRLHRGAVQFKSSAFVSILIRLRRRELVTTQTEEKAMAAEAIIGERSRPKAG